jgi:hypothetical protein
MEQGTVRAQEAPWTKAARRRAMRSGSGQDGDVQVGASLGVQLGQTHDQRVYGVDLVWARSRGVHSGPVGDRAT